MVGFADRTQEETVLGRTGPEKVAWQEDKEELAPWVVAEFLQRL